MDWGFTLLNTWVFLIFLWVAYILSLAVRRLYLSPLAAFPGPKLAALSNWYEFYYDVIKQGQFTFHIRELHKIYGPIIRITPTELHIDDPDYFDTLYSRAGRWDRYEYFSGRFGYASDSMSTVPHDLHRSRRKAIGPFFSVSKIDQFQDVIREKVNKFCHKLETYKQTGEVLVLSRAWMALTTDIITEYAFAKSYNQLDSPGFVDTFHEALVTIYTTGHFALHFPIVFPVLDAIPKWIMEKIKPEILPVIGFGEDMDNEVRAIRQGINEGHRAATHLTILHELLNSDLPPEEKSDSRLGDEAQLVVAAGLITTSWALAVGSFYIAKDSNIVHKLRQELASQSSPVELLDWHTLEKLPYLNGCVHEAIRLSHGVATRSPRLSPDAKLTYGKWTIPKNTPVSMTAIHILMNEDIFPEPHSFIPERWHKNQDLDRYFVPFSKGTRVCLGINLALAELYITLATVFSRFTFDLYETDVTDVEMKYAYLVPYPKWDSKGVRVRVKAARGES